jgi:hypothetical protein
MLLTAGGCDKVFGLTGYEVPCDLHAFTGTPKPVIPVEDAARDDAGLVVGVSGGLPFELAPGSAPQPIDLGIYVPSGVALAPEGDALFFSGAIEPPLLQTAKRLGSGDWVVGGDVPAGVYAGATTAVALGPRRVLARLHDATQDVQEYEQTELGTWQPINGVLSLPSVFAPSLLPNGLTLVFATLAGGSGGSGVYAAQRDSLDAAFGTPRLVLAGSFNDAAMTSQCSAVAVADRDSGMLEVFSQ